MSFELKILEQKHIRQSTVNDWCMCPRYWLWRHGAGLVQKRQYRQEALDIGTLLHAAMEDHVLQLHGKQKKGESKLSAAYTRIQGEIALNWTMSNGEIGPEAVGELRTLEENRDLAVAMSAVWVQRYPVPKEWKLLGTELEITAQIAGIHLPIRGTLDLVWQRPDGSIVIDDYKTCSESPIERARSIPMEIQPQVYPILAAQFCKDNKIRRAKVKAFRHCLIEKPGIRLCGKDHKAVEQGKAKTAQEAYNKRVLDWYTGKGDYEKDADTIRLSPRMARSELSFDMSDLVYDKATKSWGSSPLDLETYATLANHARAAAQSDYLVQPVLHWGDIVKWQRNRSACQKWGKPCAYLDLCISESTNGGATAAGIVAERFKVEQPR